MNQDTYAFSGSCQVVHGWIEWAEKNRSRVNKNILSSPFSLLWEGIIFPISVVCMQISGRPQSRVHFPKRQLPSYPWEWLWQPQQQGIYIFCVFTGKLRRHVTKPLEFWTTFSGSDPLRTDRRAQKNKDGPAQKHTWRVLSPQGSDEIETVQCVHMKRPGRRISASVLAKWGRAEWAGLRLPNTLGLWGEIRRKKAFVSRPS